VRASGGKLQPPELNLPCEPPGCFLWLWMIFTSLNYSRQYTTNAIPIAFTNQEILAWSTLNDEKLSKQELALLRQMDVEWINTRIQLQREMNNG
jgi:hypothetical protein